MHLSDATLCTSVVTTQLPSAFTLTANNRNNKPLVQLFQYHIYIIVLSTDLLKACRNVQEQYFYGFDQKDYQSTMQALCSKIICY